MHPLLQQAQGAYNALTQFAKNAPQQAITAIGNINPVSLALSSIPSGQPILKAAKNITGYQPPTLAQSGQQFVQPIQQAVQNTPNPFQPRIGNPIANAAQNTFSLAQNTLGNTGFWGDAATLAGDMQGVTSIINPQRSIPQLTAAQVEQNQGWEAGIKPLFDHALLNKDPNLLSDILQNHTVPQSYLNAYLPQIQSVLASIITTARH
jgi:hypothetical protein